MYGTLVIAYLFLGGAAGGAFLVTAVWSLALHRKPLGQIGRASCRDRVCSIV